MSIFQKHFDLDTYSTKYDHMNALTLPYFINGRTRTSLAINNLYESMYTSSAGDRRDVDNVALLFTDGRSENRLQTLEQARAARARGIHFIVVLLGDVSEAGQKEGAMIATMPHSENLVYAPDFNSLDDLTDSVTDLVCNGK